MFQMGWVQKSMEWRSKFWPIPSYPNSKMATFLLSWSDKIALVVQMGISRLSTSDDPVSRRLAILTILGYHHQFAPLSLHASMQCGERGTGNCSRILHTPLAVRVGSMTSLVKMRLNSLPHLLVELRPNTQLMLSVMLLVHFVLIADAYTIYQRKKDHISRFGHDLVCVCIQSPIDSILPKKLLQPNPISVSAKLFSYIIIQINTVFLNYLFPIFEEQLMVLFDCFDQWLS